MRVAIGGVFKTVDSIKISAGGVWKPVNSTRVSIGGVWKTGETFAPPITLAITPATVRATGIGLGPDTLYTDPATAMPTGGAGPYTYAWTRLTGSGAATTPTAATTTFSALVPAGTIITGTFRCTVTDALGSTAIASVNARFDNLGT